MRKASFSICPEGAAAIGFSVFSGLLFAIMDWWIPALIFWVFAFFSLHFFRDPERVPPEAAGAVASPADGTIIKIESRPDPFDGDPRETISIFMNIFNVHVNRAPVNCQVKAIRYIPGAFFNASFDKASADNERCLWKLQAQDGKSFTMVQIAGLVARRIVCRAEKGDQLGIGERMGMIRFGSRVDLYLPAGYSATVNLKDRVYAGETMIARKD